MTKNIVRQLYKDGFSEYEILLCIFLKHFKFLNNYGKYGGYQLKSYSWLAYEQKIIMYSLESRISITFLFTGDSVNIYFEKVLFLVFKDVWRLDDILHSRSIVLPDIKFTMDSLDRSLKTLESIFRNHLRFILEGKEWKEKRNVE